MQIIDNPMLNGETIRLDGAHPDGAPMTDADDKRPAPSARGGVLVITINRPEVRNAINTATAWAISARRWTSSTATPPSSPACSPAPAATFCAGMDLKAFLAGEQPSVGDRGFAGIVERPPAKPLIAAVEGYALAGGFEIVLACDLIVAADNAAFGLPEVKRGLVAAGGGLLRLPRRIPYHLAMEWALTGDFVPAATRRTTFGLVNRLVRPAAPLDDARRPRRDDRRPTGRSRCAATKQILVESRDWPRTRSSTGSARSACRSGHRADAREGARAFKEKRAPQWPGR